MVAPPQVLLRANKSGKYNGQITRVTRCDHSPQLGATEEIRNDGSTSEHARSWGRAKDLRNWSKLIILSPEPMHFGPRSLSHAQRVVSPVLGNKIIIRYLIFFLDACNDLISFNHSKHFIRYWVLSYFLTYALQIVCTYSWWGISFPGVFRHNNYQSSISILCHRLPNSTMCLLR